MLEPQHLHFFFGNAQPVDDRLVTGMVAGIDHRAVPFHLLALHGPHCLVNHAFHPAPGLAVPPSGKDFGHAVNLAAQGRRGRNPDDGNCCQEQPVVPLSGRQLPRQMAVFAEGLQFGQSPFPQGCSGELLRRVVRGRISCASTSNFQ